MKKSFWSNYTTRKYSQGISCVIRFLVNMSYAYEDRDNLYLVIDIMTGCDLRYHLGKHRRFNEEQTSKRVLAG